MNEGDLTERENRILDLIRRAVSEYSEEYHIVALPRFMAKKFVAYCAMREDLILIRSYIDKIEANSDVAIVSALNYALIALYGKCFTDASKNSYPKLEPSEIFSDNKLKQTHEYLMELRHQFIAHRGTTESEVDISIMLLSKTDASTQAQVRFKQVKQLSLNREKLKDVSVLLDFLIKTLEPKIQKAAHKLHDGFFNQFNEKEISLMMLNNIKE